MAASATAFGFEDLTADGQTMNQLQESNATLSQMVVELEEYRQEANRLESLIGLHDAYGFTSVAARVTGIFFRFIQSHYHYRCRLSFRRN